MAAAFADLCRFTPTLGGTTDFIFSAVVLGCQSPAAANLQNGVKYKLYAVSADLSQWETFESAYNSSTGTFPRTTVLYNSLGTGTATPGQSGAGTKINFSTVPQVAVVGLAEDLPSAVAIIGLVEFWPTSTVQASRLKCNGASYSRTTYADLFNFLVKPGTATFTNGSANVGMAAHGLSVSDPIKLFNSGGALPTNFTAGTHGLITAGTVYYIKSVVDANTVTLAATVGGTAVSAGSAGTGTQSYVSAPHGDGDGSTTFTVPEMRGEFIRLWDDARGVDTNRALGIDQLDAMQGHDHTLSCLVGAGGATFATGSGCVLSVATTSGPVSDGTNGTPRTAAETRPRNMPLMATIRYAA